MYAIDALDYLHEELQEINEKYEQLKKNISDERPKLYIDNELPYNKNGHNKIQSIIASRETSKEKFRQSM
ncbi:hypothetical protein NOVO_01110 [Rickettsiales bacterium Ac37b]|nr:hypothetical protein NOVO_01110 [Rickettsiales bacterium Ac37b]